MTITEIAPSTTPSVTDPDPDFEEPKEAHIVRREDQMRGYVMGDAIKALCGKLWVPSRDPENLPVCKRCKEIKEQIISAQGGNN